MSFKELLLFIFVKVFLLVANINWMFVSTIILIIAVKYELCKLNIEHACSRSKCDLTLKSKLTFVNDFVPITQYKCL